MIQSVVSKVEQIKTIVAKPDNPLWRKIANWAIVLGGPACSILIKMFVPEPYKELANQLLIGILALLKAGSKLTVK